MRKIISSFLALALCLGMTACHTVAPEVAAYRKHVQSFDSLDLQQLNEKNKNKESFFVYIGRENCPYCVKLVPELLTIQKKLNIKFYYLNVIKPNKETDAFFDELKLEYVPSIVYSFEGEFHNIPLDYDYVKKNGVYESKKLYQDLKEAVDLTKLLKNAPAATENQKK